MNGAVIVRRRADPGMIAGLGTILCVLRFTSVAFTWYVMIGSLTTLLIGALVSRLLREKLQMGEFENG